MNTPTEVKEYYQAGSHDAVSVKVDPPYSILVTFENGEIRRKNMKDEMTGVMAVLKEEQVFATVHIKRGQCIVWDTPNGEIDIDKDAVYIYGEKITPESSYQVIA